MDKHKTISEWMFDRGISVAQLATSSGLDQKTVAAIVVGRYTTSPAQRQNLADVLDVSPDKIRWDQAVQVDHMYGHGPQFGRSP